MKATFAAKNLLSYNASFWSELEHHVPEEIAQQLSELYFTLIL